MPGPLSYYSWLLYMLEPDAWGDAATLILMSYKLQVPMATIDADDLFVRQYRQEWPLELQEIVLCYQNQNHYLPCSKYKIRYGYFIAAPMLNGCRDRYFRRRDRWVPRKF